MKAERVVQIESGNDAQPAHSRGNSRNGTRDKTMLTDVVPVEVDVPRGRDATFEPNIVRKRQRLLDGVDTTVISLVAKAQLKLLESG